MNWHEAPSGEMLVQMATTGFSTGAHSNFTIAMSSIGSIAAAVSGAGLSATADDLAWRCLSESQDFHRHLT